jgi:ATPase subunit of ABC transporter with duplicated ATPase domains
VTAKDSQLVTQPYLRAHSLSHHYGGELLFSDASLVLNPGDRIGLVGPNGAGKTTLLRILAGQLRPAGGQVTSRARIGWCGQEAAESAGAEPRTVGEYLAGGLGRVATLATRMRALESAMTTADQQVLAEYARVQDEWSLQRGWAADARLATVRDQLGLAHLPDRLPLSRASGGERARLTLASLLLAEPDVLVLDEPTNHLDASGAGWLGGYLARFGGGVIVASHDRGFLDQAVSQIIELDGIDPRPAFYQGGYTQYRAEKARRWERWLLDFEAQQKYRTRLEADIAAVKEQALATELSTRNDVLRRYAKKVAKKAKARERRLERQIQSVRWLAAPQTRPPLVVTLPAAASADGGARPDGGAGPEPLVSARGLSVCLGGRQLLRDVDLDLLPSDRVLVSGPNGAGKTTLLRALAGELAPAAGRVDAALGPAVLSQRHDNLPATMPVLDFLRARVALYADDAEQLLTAYQFGPEQWGAQLRTLSQGEVRRLLLAVLVNSGSPVLMLDEPTHYLDFDSLDVVEEALRAYPGTLVMVTHDWYFAERVGYTRHWRISDGLVTEARDATKSNPDLDVAATRARSI